MIKFVAGIFIFLLILFGVSALVSGSGARSAIPSTNQSAAVGASSVRGISTASERTEIPDLLEVTTLGANNFDGTEADVFAEFDFDGGSFVDIVISYGRDQNSLTETSAVVRKAVGDSDTVKVTLTNLDSGENYFYRAIAESQSGAVAFGDIESFTADTGRSRSGNANEPKIETNKARFVEEDSAVLRGEVEDVEGFTPLLVFFVYGTSEERITDQANNPDFYDDIALRGSSQQKLIVDRSLREESEINFNVRRLPNRSDIFFTMCTEFNQSNTRAVVCGEVESFETEDNNQPSNGGEPVVTTIGARDVSVRTAIIQGNVFMNGFENGLVFFVYGEDEDDIQEVETLNRFSEVEEDDEDILRERVDRDLDGNRQYQLEVDLFSPGRDYFYRICVEYEDSGVAVLECGRVQDFEADREERD